MAEEIKITIPASISFEELENSINAKESIDRIKLTGLSKNAAPGKKENIGVFVERPRGVRAPKLHLVKVGNRDTIENITERQSEEGRELVFHSVVFLQGREKDIAGFR